MPLNLRGRIAVAALLLLALLASGCLHQPEGPVVTFGSASSGPRPERYRVEPFVSLLPPADSARYPDAARIVAAAVEAALFRGKLPVVRDDSATVLVGGTVKTFTRGSFWGGYSTVVVGLVASDRATGTVLWRADDALIADMDYSRDPVSMADDVARRIVDALLATGRMPVTDTAPAP